MHRTPNRPAALRPWAWLATALLAALIIAAAAPARFPDDPPAAANTATKAASPEALALDHKVIAEVKDHSEVMANLTHLSDVIGPRLTGSAALKRANDWAADRMRSYGLSNVHLEPYTIPAGWERGTASLRIVEPDNGRNLTAAALGWTPSTPGKVVGEVVIVNARKSADLAAYKGKLKGAVVLRGDPSPIRPVTDTSFGLPGERRGNREGRGGRDGQPGRDGQQGPPARDGQPGRDGAPNRDGQQKRDGQPARDGQAARDGQPGQPGADGQAGPPTDMMRMFQQMMAFRREMTEFLRNEGVVAVLMDSGKPHGLLTTTGGWRPTDDRANATDPLPALYVAHEHYAQLFRLAKRPAPAKTRVELEVTNKLISGPITVYNTVGEIPGSEKPNEYVFLGAHIDSWDLGQGTTDNGTGTCVVLEAARALAKSGVRPKRTIRFCLFSGEEQGLYGSQAYVKAHKDEMARTSMCLVHDTGTGKVMGIGLQGREGAKKILDPELGPVLKELGVGELNLRGMGGSDHMSFEQAGVPGFAVQQDPAEYRFTHHSQSDTLDKAKEADLIQGGQVMAVAALHAANLPSLLPHEKPPGRRFGPPPTEGDKAKVEEKGQAAQAKDKPAPEKKPETKPQDN
jgi:hypothetical protein